MVDILQFVKLSLVNVIRPSSSLGARWPEGRSSSSVSQYLPSCFGSACQMAVEEQTLRCAQLSAQLSAELCSPDLRHFHATLGFTESIHFLWPLNRKFSG